MLATSVHRVVVLDKFDKRQQKYALILRRNRVEIEEAEFTAGHLMNPAGESIYLASRRISCELALISARKLIEAQPLLQQLNLNYRRETLLLSVAKFLTPSIESYVVRIQAAQSLAHPLKADLWLVAPLYFPADLLKSDFSIVRLRFYEVPQSRFQLLFMKLLKAYALHCSRLFRFARGSVRQEDSGSFPSVLMVQEDNIRLDRTLRGQPHWLNPSYAPPQFKTYITDLRSLFYVADDVKDDLETNVALVGTFVTWVAWLRRKKQQPLCQLARDRRALLLAAIRERGFSETAALLHAFQLFLVAERLGSLAAYLKSGVFLTQELSGDSIQLVAEELGVRTIAVQYSNMGFLSPWMMSTADYYVIFSDMYKEVFGRYGIAPKQWLITGYLHDQVARMVQVRANAHRESLRFRGAEFVICYFDESVQHDKWGLVSQSDHLTELQELARAVLDDDSLGVVTKSQFIKNSPSQLYPNDALIQGARATGRFLELMEGKHRNDIYPVEAALAADICISHNFGATAALEAALASVRVVLVNPYGGKTNWDSIYAKANIQYPDVVEALRAIVRYRSGDCMEQTLGDWTHILHHFDPYRDGGAAARLRKIVEEAVRDSAVGGLEHCL